MSDGHKLIQASLRLGDVSLSQEGDYVEYENDDPASGMVVFRRQGGEPFMFMSVETYDALIEVNRTTPAYRFTVKL